MINTDLQNELLKINSEWKSNSRIYGEVIEMWVENNVPCKCGGKFINQPANQKSIDCICDKCLKNIQFLALDLNYLDLDVMKKNSISNTDVLHILIIFIFNFCQKQA